MRIDISIFGDTQFSRDLGIMGERGLNMDPVFASIFDRIREINAEQILSRGARGGTPWLPLKPATILQKAREHAPHPDWPEYRTSALYQALSHKDDQNNEEILNGDWAVFRVTGDPGEYGPIQSRGSEAAGIPARPLFRLTEQDRREFVDEMRVFIIKGEVRGFFV